MSQKVKHNYFGKSKEDSIKKKYRLSFGAGGSLYVVEGKIFVDLFFELDDWSRVLEVIKKKNVLQFNSNLTTKRRASELCLRLKSLSVEELLYYSEADFQDDQFYPDTLCRTYDFIGDFSSKVILESFSKYRLELIYADFDFFFEEEKQWHPELEKITEITRKKLRQVLFKMMREAGFLSSQSQLQSLLPSTRLRNLTAETRRDISRFIPGGAI